MHVNTLVALTPLILVKSYHLAVKYFTIYPSLFLENETREFSDKASKMAVM